MSDQIPENVATLLKKHGLASKDAVWELPQKKGCWILKHKTLEQLAAKEKIVFDMSLEHMAENNVVVKVTGSLGDRVEISFGEASPQTSQNKYYVAMAEKRGKDRVILKLLGLHGDVYSEEEADDFKSPIGDAGYENAAARNEVARLLEVMFDNWTPAMCELDFLKKVGRRLVKSEPQLTEQYKGRFDTLEQLEKDFESEADYK